VTRRVMALATPRIHHDALGWVRRVVANGGSCSQSTLRSVSAFCDAIERAGIRDRFYRLNLFCGNSDANLAAVRTPLFRGPSLTGTQYGNATDTNLNFVAGDYAETGASGGLTGTGTVGGKVLRTGLTPAALPVIATGHLSVYAMSGFGGATIFALLGTLNGGFANNFFIELNRNSAGNMHGAWGGGSFSPSLVTSAQGAGIGHVLVSRTSATALSGYRNTTGTALNTQATSVTPATGTNEWLVFAHNDQGNPTPLNVANARMGGYSIGADMTGSQAAAFYTAMQAFQTALGRQV
jgi:hypothetical protein